MNSISKILQEHYQNTYKQFGANSKGVDWGDKEWAAFLRQNKMLDVIPQKSIKSSKILTLLDVGCGYGFLAEIIKDKGFNINYTGIDVVPEMITDAQKRNPEFNFICGDFLDIKIPHFDFVICNGILTQKTNVSTLEMNKYCQDMIRKMFDLCNIGIAFNTMSTYVNFQKENLFYKNPSELMAWCMSEISSAIKIDCAYELWYEYTVYIYKQNNV